MLYRVLADFVVVAHLAFILFVVLGGLLALRWWFAPFLHLPAAAWGVYIELSGGLCPLTPLENSLRQSAGSAGYSGGFVEHYIVPIVYPAALSEKLQMVLAGLVVLATVLVYSFVLWHKLRDIRQSRAA